MTTCIGCGREFAASSDNEALCPQCVTESINVRPPEPASSRRRQFLESPTFVLIAINVLVYLIMAIQARAITFNSELLLNWGGNSGALTSGGQWWRLLTSTFEHANLLHIAMNMWCLYSLGWLAELLFGRSRFTLLYLLCGIGGSLGSICWRGNGLSVGASGAIFGIAGALIPAMLLHSNQQLRTLLKGQLTSIALFVFYNLAFGVASKGTDNAAHIGGLLTGLVLGVIFPTGPERHLVRGKMRVVAGTLLMLLAFAGAGAFARQHNAPYVEIEQAADAHERGATSAAIVHAQRAATLLPSDPRAQFMLGTLLLDAQRYAEAVAPFTATIRLRPDFGPAYVNLCIAQREVKLLKEALTSCEQGAKLSSNDAEAWFNLGRARYDMHDLTGARDALAKSVALNPEGFDENLQYALMLISTNETSKALPYLQKAHNLRPQDDDVTKLLARAKGQ